MKSETKVYKQAATTSSTRPAADSGLDIDSSLYFHQNPLDIHTKDEDDRLEMPQTDKKEKGN